MPVLYNSNCGFPVLAKVAESIGGGGGSKEWVTVGVPLIMCYPDVDLLIKNVYFLKGVITKFQHHLKHMNMSNLIGLNLCAVIYGLLSYVSTINCNNHIHVKPIKEVFTVGFVVFFY